MQNFHGREEEEVFAALEDEVGYDEEAELPDAQPFSRQQQTQLPASQQQTAQAQNIRSQSSAQSGGQDLFNVAMLMEVQQMMMARLREQLQGEISTAAERVFNKRYCAWRDV